MKAKYYIYRNLHTGNFSVKYKGIVIAHVDTAMLYGCEFRVSEKGRQKVIREKRKNVHATIACESYSICSQDKSKDTKIYYNPYKTNKFMINGEDITTHDTVMIHNNVAYV